MKDINELVAQVRRFRDERDWAQFHNPKDMAISLALEAAEVLEHFQWKSAKEIDEHLASHRDEVADELGDVLVYLLEFCDVVGVDIVDAALNKLAKNAIKYPVAKAKGTHAKYNKL